MYRPHSLSGRLKLLTLLCGVCLFFCLDQINFFSFLQDELTENQELIQTYRLHIAQDINQDNLALFCGSYQ